MKNCWKCWFGSDTYLPSRAPEATSAIVAVQVSHVPIFHEQVSHLVCVSHGRP